MSLSPHTRRTIRATRTARATRATRTAVGALGAAGLVALGVVPAAFADTGDADGPGLVVRSEPVHMKPGDSTGIPVTVANKGSGTVDELYVGYSVTRGVEYGSVPSNCETSHSPSFDEAPAHSYVVCAFHHEVAPGTVYAPAEPLAIKATDHALRDELRVWVSTTPGVGGDNVSDPVPGTAPAVELAEQPSGTAGEKGAVDVDVSTDNTADFRLTGAHLKGRVGDTVPMTVKFTNAGPGWVLGPLDRSVATVLVTPPAGTSVVKGDGFCDAADGSYNCGTSQRWVDENDGETYTFKLKIDKKVPGAKGSVTFGSGARPFDPDKSNDKATITLDVTDGGATGGSGGSQTAGGSAGSSGGSDGTTGGSGGSGGGSASGGDSGSGATGGDGATTSGGGDLASTGSSDVMLPIAGAAIAAVGVGTGAVYLVRRRRTQSHV